ncbi:Vacuolar inheritance and morphology protein [Coniothyrium glycines]
MTTVPADDDAGGYQSLTGVLESAEPASTPTASRHAQAQAQAQAPAPPTPALDTSANKGPRPAAATEGAPAASMRHPALSGARSLNVSGSPSSATSATSPLSSRDASPARPHRRTSAGHPTATGTSTNSNTKPGFRSRKSSTDVSPSRGPSLAGTASKIPSVASLPRALSATSIPELTPTTSTDTVKAPRPIKPASGPISGDTAPHWPISPRLRSPPPGDDGRSRSRANSLRSQIKKPEAQSTPAIVVQSSSPASISRLSVRDEASLSDPEDPAMSIKGPSRGASGAAPKLETVQESSLPATPGFDGLEIQSFVSSSSTHKDVDDDRHDVSSSKVTEDLSTKRSTTTAAATKNTESGSDSGTKSSRKGKMQEQRTASTQRPNTVSSKPSLSSLSSTSRTRDPPLRNMTVETETVPSVAQSTIGNQDRAASGRVDGSLRLKPSNETIRPKKERKPPKRKAPSINSGTASSKADVFEQKVASAVDEANSSDSDATFIYESNPPEHQPHRSRQHHSRTPSMTSIASLADPRLQTHKNPNKKSSMKFTNPYNNPSIDGDGDRGDAIRNGPGRAGGSHHHHVGRHGPGRGNLSHLVMDSDSSMPQSSRARGPSSRQTSQPNSPRFHTFNVGNGHGISNKKHGEYSAAYDIDVEHIADDERTPLIPSGRSPRIRTPRRRNSATIRQLERRHRHDGGWCRGFAGCLVLSILLLVVIFSAVGLIFASTKPLTSVAVRSIQNVVASQEEIILDLVVDAVNPNINGVSVSDMDVIIFAKSKHVGSDTWWREHGNGPPDNKEDWQDIDSHGKALEVSVDGIDEGTDPVEAEPRTMVLGHISHFESPLNFDGSFFQRRRAESIGEIRLSHPGNKTEAGGTARWEEVLQYPFEFIVRGNLQYTLPLSTREFKVSITSSYYYDPDLEKKRLVDPSVEQFEGKRRITSVTSTPSGRYDRRAFLLLES